MQSDSRPTEAVLRQMAEAVIRLTCGPAHLYGAQLDTIAANVAAALDERARLGRQPLEPAAEPIECRYCKRPVNADGGIYHEGNCAGLQERSISRLRLDWLREHPESVAYEFSVTKEAKP